MTRLSQHDFMSQIPNFYSVVLLLPSFLRLADIKELRESYDVQQVEGGTLPDKEVPGLRPAVQQMMKVCQDLACRVLTAMAIGLGESWGRVCTGEGLRRYDISGKVGNWTENST